MYAMQLCQARIDLTFTVQTPTHVGGSGASGQLHGFREQAAARSKSRSVSGIHLRSAPRKNPLESSLVLPLHRVDGAGLYLFVPGTSVRGAVRHFLWKRLRRAGRDIKVDPRWRLDRPPPPTGQEADHEGPDASSPAYWEPRFGGVLMRHLFGSEARRGALRFSDLRVQDEQDLRVQDEQDPPTIAYSDGDEILFRPPRPQAPLRTLVRNRLDRFTMASTEGLRNLAAIDAGTVFSGHIQLDNFSWWQLGALGLALHGMNEGSIRLGRRGGTGLGAVKAEASRLVLRWHRRVAPKALDVAPESLVGAGDAWDCLNRLARPGADLDRHMGRFGPDGQMRQMFVPTRPAGPRRLEGAELVAASPYLPFVEATWEDGAVVQQMLVSFTSTLAETARSLHEGPNHG